MAPPDPTVELELSDDSATSLDQYYKDAENATESAAEMTPNKSHLSRRSLEKRGSGPLYFVAVPRVSAAMAQTIVELGARLTAMRKLCAESTVKRVRCLVA
ncbi:hypothetical protein IL306_004687 [Fusarium sp. DS 682]|nr:hypothetical protein IL306_004687 [Fusarium sp. DS 682]